MTKEEAYARIDEIANLIEAQQEELKKLNEIISSKLTKEERFVELINGLDIKIDKDKYPNSLLFFKNGGWILEIKNKILWVRWSLFWRIFEDEYSMNYHEIKGFIKDQVEKHFKINGLTPSEYMEDWIGKVEKHFKINGIAK